MVIGPAADVNNVSVVKGTGASLSVTITRPSTNVKYISLKAYFSDIETSNNNTCSVIFPETTGKTSMDQSQRPIAFRFTPGTYANGSPASTASNSSGTMTVNVTGLLQNVSNSILLLW
jgi:hypothetical protein